MSQREPAATRLDTYTKVQHTLRTGHHRSTRYSPRVDVHPAERR